MNEVFQILIRGLRLSCPACGRTNIFRSVFKTKEACDACGLVYAREQGFFMGAIYLNVVATNFLILAVYLTSLYAFRTTEQVIYSVMFAMAIIFPLFFFHWSRSLWLSLNFIISPQH